MTVNLEEILKKHALWIRDDVEGERANLRGADLINANLSFANLSGADLSGADLRGAILSGANLIIANLSFAILSNANLSDAILSGADLIDADLSDADLIGANLSDADLSDAYLIGADLRSANLHYASLCYANLSGTNLSGADLSGAKGIVSPTKYMAENFKSTSEGYIVYKNFNGTYTSPKHWTIAPNCVISETCNTNRMNSCGCGINVAPLEWVINNNKRTDDIWELLIKWEWLPGVVVPYNTEGNIRCELAQILRHVEQDELA